LERRAVRSFGGSRLRGGGVRRLSGRKRIRYTKKGINGKGRGVGKGDMSRGEQGLRAQEREDSYQFGREGPL